MKAMRALALVFALAAAGCVVVPEPGPYYASESVWVAPPSPRVEVIGVAPGPGHFWIGGYWTWRGSHHEWVPGRWQAPRRGYRWVPHRWDHDHDHWRERRGGWEHD